MTDVIIVLIIISVLNIAVFLLYFKRTKRLLFKYREFTNQKVEGAFKRVESRLVHGVSDFERTNGKNAVWAVMFTYERKEMAVHTLESLRKYEPNLPVIVIDNGSKDGTQEVLTQMLLEGRIQKVLFNTHQDVPQWQKAFALRQALKLLAMEYPSYIVWLDDDLEITRPFVQDGIALLDVLRDEKVKVINMTDNEIEERNHPTIKRVNVMVSGLSEAIKIRPTFNGQFNIFAADFFHELGYPPIAEGISELDGEDWFYSRQLQNRGYRVAVFEAAKHLGAGAYSKREEIEKNFAM
jgi:GT2 family glycosyltransferase